MKIVNINAKSTIKDFESKFLTCMYVYVCVWTLVKTRGVYALPKKIANRLNFVNLIKMDKSI